jgi:hypothetical protein
MFRTLANLYPILLGICRFERGPQDIPTSKPLLWLGLTLYTLTIIGVEWFKLPFVSALLWGILETLFMVAVVISATFFKRVLHRLPQTLTAITLIGTAVNLALLLCLAMVSLAPAPLLATNITVGFSLPLLAWNAVMNAHILRHTLEKRFAYGLVLAVLILAVSWAIGLLLYPTDAPGAMGVGAMGRRAS